MESRVTSNEINNNRRTRNYTHANHNKRLQKRTARHNNHRQSNNHYQSPLRLPRYSSSVPRPIEISTIQLTEQENVNASNTSTNNENAIIPKRSKSLPKRSEQKYDPNKDDLADLPDYETAVRKLNTHAFHIPLSDIYGQESNATNNNNSAINNNRNVNFITRFFHLNKNKTSFYLAFSFVIILIVILIAIFVVIILNLACEYFIHFLFAF
jgi:hypothetical protein